MESGQTLHDQQKIKSEDKTSVWGTALKTFAATGITAGIILHFIGNVTHEIYLGQWGIAASQFPKTADWISTNGYFTLFSQLASIFVSLKKTWVGILEFWVTMVLVVAYLFFLRFINQKIDSNESIVAWVASRNPFIRMLVKFLFLGSVLTTVIGCGLFLTTSVLSIPVLIGSAQGKFQAAEDLKNFQKGCAPTQSRKCIALMKDGKVIAKGFIIDSSETRIALYDEEAGYARVLELAGFELASAPVINKPTAR